MGVPRFLVAFTCNMIVAQRLVRKVCKSCTQPYTLKKEQVEEINRLYNFEKVMKTLVANKLTPDLSLDQIQFHRGAGCKMCNDEGYKGRVGIYEVLETTREIQDLINKNASSGEIQDAAEAAGMINLVTDGFAKAIAGTTSLEEIMRVTKE
jgi:type II secretory ATPase GspE/PulE/Tfp pilus assembly ATPase PilB-like protein